MRTEMYDKRALNMTRAIDAARQEPYTLLDPYTVQRAGGDTLTLGRCPLCGRQIPLSRATKSGSTCRYEGAKFNLEGVMINTPWKD